MDETPFTNREEELRVIRNASSLLNLYGEHGIGKSRLVREAAALLKKEGHRVLQINLSEMDAEPGRELEATVAALESELGLAHATDKSLEFRAGAMRAALLDLAQAGQVFLFVDATEARQEDMAFWNWLERNLVGPLASEDRIHQVFVGQMPTPWRRAEVRLSVERYPLERLAPPHADAVAAAALRPAQLETSYQQAVMQVIASLAFGLPRLIERLAGWFVNTPARPATEHLEANLARDVVRPFIFDDLFCGIPDPWPDILWWASALDFFDATLLPRYLRKLDRLHLSDDSDFFFIQGLQQMRIQYKVVFQAKEGDRLYGVLRDIVRKCFQTVAPDEFAYANQAYRQVELDLQRELEAAALTL